MNADIEQNVKQYNQCQPKKITSDATTSMGVAGVDISQLRWTFQGFI